MKVVLDLDRLLAEGKISPAEYRRLGELGAEATGGLAFNLLIGFGVVMVSVATLALLPSAFTALGLGLLILLGGLWVLRTALHQWRLLGNICVLVGALMAGVGLVAAAGGAPWALWSMALLYTLCSLIAHSNLLAVLAVLAVGASVGARTGYLHAMYFLGIEMPAVTIALFTALGVGLYRLSKILPVDWRGLVIVAARTCVLLVNFGFWIGSLWGDRLWTMTLPRESFAIGWALALLAVALWAYSRGRRWVLNSAAVFGGIHFYTQWFENLGATPGTVLIAGLLALGAALGLQQVNRRLGPPAPLP